MADVSETLEAKSNQLNAVDIMGVEPVITVREVSVSPGGDQPISVYFNGDNNKPWKPSKGMRRILAAGWGRNSDDWIGRSVKIYFEESVTFGGKEVGGIRIRSMSDIPAAGINCALTISRTKREAYHVPLLVVSKAVYPDADFDKRFPAMQKKMESGDMTLTAVIAQCQKTGELTADQLARLEAAVPVDITEHDDEEVY